jgi:hypothetical protein
MSRIQGTFGAKSENATQRSHKLQIASFNYGILERERERMLRLELEDLVFENSAETLTYALAPIPFSSKIFEGSPTNRVSPSKGLTPSKEGKAASQRRKPRIERESRRQKFYAALDSQRENTQNTSSSLPPGGILA